MDSCDAAHKRRRQLEPSIPPIQEQSKTQLQIVSLGRVDPDGFVYREPIEKGGGQLLGVSTAAQAE
jgi:hypothetical protein